MNRQTEKIRVDIFSSSDFGIARFQNLQPNCIAEMIERFQTTDAEVILDGDYAIYFHYSKAVSIDANGNLLLEIGKLEAYHGLN